VHGYNVNFAEGLYRHAQISHDFKNQSVSVNYSWPSACDFRAYAKASSLPVTGWKRRLPWSRAATCRKSPSWAIVLVAPDLDIDAFAEQAASVSEFDVPIHVFVSNRDRAPRVSSLLRANTERL
jgi:esterase/lipase superfamily enzyme